MEPLFPPGPSHEHGVVGHRPVAPGGGRASRPDWRIGIGTGVALGTALGNLAPGIAIGAGIGVTLGIAFERGRESEPLTPVQRRLLAVAVALGLLVGLAVLVLSILG